MNTGFLIVIGFTLSKMKLDMNLVNHWRFGIDLYLSSLVHPHLFQFLEFFQNLCMHDISFKVKTWW